MYHVNAQGVDERMIMYIIIITMVQAQSAYSGVCTMVQGQSVECAPWFRDSQWSVHHGSGTVSGVCTMVRGQSAYSGVCTMVRGV